METKKINIFIYLFSSRKLQIFFNYQQLFRTPHHLPNFCWVLYISSFYTKLHHFLQDFNIHLGSAIFFCFNFFLRKNRFRSVVGSLGVAQKLWLFHFFFKFKDHFFISLVGMFGVIRDLESWFYVFYTLFCFESIWILIYKFMYWAYT